MKKLICSIDILDKNGCRVSCKGMQMLGDAFHMVDRHGCSV